MSSTTGASVSGDGNVLLIWTAGAANGSTITSYSVEQSTNGGATWTPSRTANAVTGTSATIVGLVAGVSYSFRVKGIYATASGSAYTGASGASNAVVAGVTLGSVVGLTASRSSISGRIDLSWSAPTDIDTSTVANFLVEYGTDGTTWTLSNTYSSTTTTASVGGLTNGTVYYFRVTTVTTGSGSATAVTSLTPAQVSGAPTALVITATTANALNLSWAAPTNSGGYPIVGYLIEINSGSGYTPAINGALATVTSAVISGLSAGTTYTFKVAAVTLAGTGAFGTPAQGTVLNPASAATNFRATPTGTGALTLTWTAPSNLGGQTITAYQIRQSADGSNWTDLTPATASQVSYLVNGLTNGTLYYFQITVVTSAGLGSSASTSGTPATIAGAPTNLTATASGNNTIALSWLAPTLTGGAPITAYKIEISSDSGVTWDSVTESVTVTAYNYTATLVGIPLLFRVSAVTSAGIGTASTPATVTARALPGAPSGLVITPGDRSLILNWSAPAGTITGYRVEHSTNGSTWIIDTTTVLTSFTIDTGLTNGTSYFVRISAINEAGIGAGVVGNGTPAAIATAPSSVITTPVLGGILVNWAAPSFKRWLRNFWLSN
jgi:hypothetical protein